MAALRLSVAPDGVITTIYSDALADLLDEGKASVARASHVEPGPNGGWIADMSPVGGPVLGAVNPFRLRQEALDAEVEYLNNHLF